MRKPFDELTIVDDFMFCAVMQDKKICTTLLNAVLNNNIGTIIDIVYQKTLSQMSYARGIRLDVWVKDNKGKTYDIEMQTVQNSDLARRLRYYQSIIDTTTLEKGQHYSTLKDSFILFFCPFDYIKKGLPVYSFQTRCCENTDIVLHDGMTKIIINSTAAEKATNADLQAFLAFMNGQKTSRPFISQLEHHIQTIKHNETRRNEYMQLRILEMDARREGLEQGLQQKARETARILKELGDSIQKIMYVTGLSQEEIEKL